ncbi:MAG: family 1 glycosylhydrolase [Actinomycetota bacterium]
MTPFVLGAATASTPSSDHLPAPVRIGADVYRFPARWDRLQPSGRGELDGDAVAHLTGFLDRLLEAGTRPALVLHRSGLPPALAEAGGWSNRATSDAFAGYAQAMARALGSRVDLWTTFDEPPAPTGPGTAELADALAAAHHLVLAHGLAAIAIRDESADARVSISLPIRVTRPVDELDTTHLEAVGAVDLLRNHVFLGPLLDGSYPTELVASTRHLCDWSFVRGGDLVTTRQRLDLLQITYRDTVQVRRGTDGEIEEFIPPGRTTSRIVDPQGLTDLLRSMDVVFPGVELMVGATCPSPPDGDEGGPDCPTYLEAHLARVEQAATDGIDVRGFLLQYDDGPAADWYAEALARHRAARAAAEALEEERASAESARPGLLRRLLRRRS